MSRQRKCRRARETQTSRRCLLGRRASSRSPSLVAADAYSWLFLAAPWTLAYRKRRLECDPHRRRHWVLESVREKWDFPDSKALRWLARLASQPSSRERMFARPPMRVACLRLTIAVRLELVLFGTLLLLQGRPWGRLVLHLRTLNLCFSFWGYHLASCDLLFPSCLSSILIF